jgi:hypothetical protein
MEAQKNLIPEDSVTLEARYETELEGTCIYLLADGMSAVENRNFFVFVPL